MKNKALVRNIAVSKTFPSIPRDARHAAASGFNFREGFVSVVDDFVDADKMMRCGTMEISDAQGNTVEVSFTAAFTFDKPVPVRKLVAA